jgi:hypothetical protein
MECGVVEYVEYILNPAIQSIHSPTHFLRHMRKSESQVIPIPHFHSFSGTLLPPLSDINEPMYVTIHELTMSHYISPNLINHPPKLFCQLAGCNIPIPLETYPPPFSLLLAASAELAPSERDVRRFFCSEEHRDQCWKTEKGWFDRRVAMPSVSRSCSS